jgi:hypothetical protein
MSAVEVMLKVKIVVVKTTQHLKAAHGQALSLRSVPPLPVTRYRIRIGATSI